MTSANNMTQRTLISKLSEMFPDAIKEKKNIKGINHIMFRGLEWNPDVKYPEEPKNFNTKKREQTKKLELNF